MKKDEIFKIVVLFYLAFVTVFFLIAGILAAEDSRIIDVISNALAIGVTVVLLLVFVKIACNESQ